MRDTAKVIPISHASKKGKMPTRPKNSDVRTREYLTPDEVDKLIKAAGSTGRHCNRDKALILIMFTHGLRAQEAAELRWDQVTLGRNSTIHINRKKNGVPSVHPLRGSEIRVLRQLQRDYPDTPYVLPTERGGPMTTSNIRKIVARAGKEAGLPFPVHPHMLRHACGYKLANDGRDTRAIQQYLGHKNIMHTVRYTELAPGRFKDFWND